MKLSTLTAIGAWTLGFDLRVFLGLVACHIGFLVVLHGDDTTIDVFDELIVLVQLCLPESAIVASLHLRNFKVGVNQFIVAMKHL